MSKELDDLLAARTLKDHVPAGADLDAQIEAAIQHVPDEQIEAAIAAVNADTASKGARGALIGLLKKVGGVALKATTGIQLP